MTIPLGYPGPRGRITPDWFRDGEAFSVEIVDLARFAGRTVQVQVSALTDVETSPVLVVPVELDGSGSGQVDLPGGITLGREGSVYVDSVCDVDLAGETVVHVFDEVLICNMNSEIPIASLDDLVVAHRRLVEAQAETYRGSLGDPKAPDALEHRVLSVIEGLLTTTRRRLPGVEIVPVAERLPDEEERELINAVLQDLGWACRLRVEDWRPVAEARRPLTLIIVSPIWATTYEDAGSLAREVRDRVLSLLALDRLARGRPICLVVEQRQPDDVVLSRWMPEQPHYAGNLAGGPIAGESQHGLLLQYRAVESDPLLKLCCDLFADAIADSSTDARYLRLWSILEILSGARLPANSPVLLRSGDPWPDAKNNTTKSATPRVYRYLAEMLDTGWDESSILAPAADLYEAVRVWYGRRNATAHYGMFVPGDVRQVPNRWYRWAIRSEGSPELRSAWIRALRQSVLACIQAELLRRPWKA